MSINTARGVRGAEGSAGLGRVWLLCKGLGLEGRPKIVFPNILAGGGIPGRSWPVLH